MNVSQKRDFCHLQKLYCGFQVSAILFEALRIGLFDAIGDRALTAKAIASRLKLSERALLRFLRVLEGLHLLQRYRTCYRNTTLSKKFLRKNGEKYLGETIRHMEILRASWSHLGTSLKKNTMVTPEKQAPAKYRKQLKQYLMSMHNTGLLKSEIIKALLPVKGYRRMLDIGGGIGTYSVCFLQKNPHMRSTVFDLKSVISYTKAYIKETGMQDRIDTVSGECLNEPFPEGQFDLVLISNVLHIYSPPECKKIIKKAAGVLSTGGTMLIHDYIFGCADPLTVSIFDITMLVGTPRGRCHDGKQIGNWMQSAGILSVKTADTGTGTAIIWGVKKQV